MKVPVVKLAVGWFFDACAAPITKCELRLRQLLGRDDSPNSYYSFAYSALACFRIGMSGSASSQSARKSSYAAFALVVSPDIA
jgi:hypothetical protein